MRLDMKLVGTFGALEALAILMVGISSLFELALYTGLGALGAAFIVRRHKTSNESRGRMGSLVFCASWGATLFALLYCAKLYLTLMFAGVMGSPYGLSALTFAWIFIKCWATAWVSIAVVLAVFDLAVRDASAMKGPTAQ